jgi:outer membrane protein OmpA-like peptidoglycan-associated protein
MARNIRLPIIGVICAALISAAAAAGPDSIKGIVVTNNNGQLTIKTPSGNQTLSVGAAAQIRSISGPLGGQKQEVPATALLPGLPVSIDMDDGGQVSRVEYKASDYKTAAQIQAGVEATAVKTQEALTALSKVGEYDVKGETNVYFTSGSAAISTTDRSSLNALAKSATSHQGYMISVLGFADPTGNAAANQRLSARRAQAVINLLKQNSAIQPGRVLSASAMGAVNLHGAKPEPTSLAQARRVTVRVLTSSAQLPSQ